MFLTKCIRSFKLVVFKLNLQETRSGSSDTVEIDPTFKTGGEVMSH